VSQNPPEPDPTPLLPAPAPTGLPSRPNGQSSLAPSAPAALDDDARRRLSQASPDSTRRAYRGDLRRFLAWAAARGHLPEPPVDGPDTAAYAAFAALATAVGPTMPLLLTNYTAHLAEAGRAPATIDRALAAILVAHQAAGLPKPSTAPARQVLRGYRRQRAAAGARPHKAAPVTIDALRAMVATLDAATLAGRRDQTILVLGFALGARRSELADLDLADLTEVDAGLEVVIRVSKTDRDSAGRVTVLPYGTHPATCPVRVARTWRTTLADLGITTGPLLRAVDRHGHLAGTPGAAGPRTTGALTGQGVALVVRRTALAAGLDPAAAWSGHSLRRGFATATYAAGADPLRIARHAGWRDGSATLLGYIEDVDRWKTNPLTGVGL